MGDFRQDIRFARTRDGLRIAYAVAGDGYPLVRCTHWLTSIEHDWKTPVLGPLLRDVSARYRFYRYNSRGYGLSEGEGTPLSIDTFVADLEAVVDAARLQCFALWGPSGGAQAAIAYAARHPDRVSHLILSGGMARGALRRNPTRAEGERFFATIKLIELGWGQDNPAFLQMLTTQLFPNATLEQMRSFNDLQRLTTSPAHAARMVMSAAEIDVSPLLGELTAPTLVLHSRGDVRVPLDEGRFLAASIPDARLVVLESDNHVPISPEPAFVEMLEQIHAFLPQSSRMSAAEATFTNLTAREREILELVARGFDNAQIAAWLTLSGKTVRNTVSHIFDKIGVENRGQAIVRARDAGFGHAR